MYDVTIINGTSQRLIHDHRGAANAQKLLSASIVDGKNAISSFTFTILPGNAGFAELNAYTTLVKVRNTKRSRDDFVGRVLQVTPEMDAGGMISKTVICEDRMGFLHDSVQPYSEVRHYTGDASRTGLEEFIDVLLANHNAQVETYKRIYRGNVTVKPFESSNDVTKGFNWETSYQALTDKLLSSFGGYLRLRETNSVLYLDYLESVGTTRSTVIELGRNMRSASKEIDPTGIVTRLVPLGAKLAITDEDGNAAQSEERLTISAINNGRNYIESAAYAQQFGIRYATVIFDDVTDAANLLSKGTKWLSDNNGLALNHRIDALDLSLIGLDIDDFVLYDRYPVKNHLLGIDDTLQIIKKTTNVVIPQDGSFEMGAMTKRLSDVFIDELLNGKDEATQGKDGKTSYLHVRYSANADGSNMTEKPGDDTKYIGICTSFSIAPPADPSFYTWSVFGGTGVGIERIVPRYAVGTSNTTAPSTPSIATWSIQAPELSYGQYLWCAYLVMYTDGSSAFTEPFSVRSADQIAQSSEAPANPTEGMLWLNTEGQPYTLMRYTGTEWVAVADYASDFDAVYTYIDTSISNVQINNDEIMAYVEDRSVSKNVYEEFASIVRNILMMEADGTTMLFQTINEAIAQVGETEATHYAELLTYIRFSDDGIEIGKQGNAITMKLDNDSLDFYSNGTLVAYMSDNTLYIMDGRFLRSVQIGNYGFIPEANGSVSFTYLGGGS